MISIPEIAFRSPVHNAYTEFILIKCQNQSSATWPHAAVGLLYRFVTALRSAMKLMPSLIGLQPAPPVGKCAFT